MGQGAFAYHTKMKSCPTEYDVSPALSSHNEFVSPRTIDLRFREHKSRDRSGTEPVADARRPPPLKGQFLGSRAELKKTMSYMKRRRLSDLGARIRGKIQIRDNCGRFLTGTQSKKRPHAAFSSPLPFSFVRRATDLGRSIVSATFQPLALMKKFVGMRRIFYETE
jgi:hypothetical protein